MADSHLDARRGTSPNRHRDFEATWAVAAAVEGWLTAPQAQRLWDSAAAVQPGEWIVEIGSHCGKSTMILASAKQDGVRVLAVDPFDDTRWGGGERSLRALLETLDAAGLRDEVELFRGRSVDAAAAWPGRRIGLLYVDGAHDYESVLADIRMWRPHVPVGSEILMHDAFSSVGVTRALVRHLAVDRSLRFEDRTGTLVRLQRTAPRASVMVVNALQVAARLPYFARNLAVKVSIRRDLPWVRRLLHHPGSEMPI